MNIFRLLLMALLMFGGANSLLAHEGSVRFRMPSLQKVWYRKMYLWKMYLLRMKAPLRLRKKTALQLRGME